MIRRFGAPLLLVLAGVPALPAQTGPAGAVPAARIDSLFRRFGIPGSPGCALGVIRDGSLVYTRGYGLASVELGVPITPSTVFDIGSVSKQFTAMSIVLLAQDGKLSLDDEIQKYLPEVPRYPAPVTIRHLLHHTSGIRDYIDLLEWSGVGEEAVTTDRDALDVIARQQRPNFPAGSEFRYSNSGFFLLSMIVQRVSGKSLRDFAAERIFGPLGMAHTQIVNRHDLVVPGKADSYGGSAAGEFRLAAANWEQTGDGAVNTTVADMVRWDHNFESGTVGGQAGIRELETTAVLSDGKPITYALGLDVSTYRGVRIVSHGGSWAGFRAQYSRFPDFHLSVVTLCNLATSGPGLLTQAVADIVLADRLGARTPPAANAVSQPAGALAAAAPEPLSALAGVYRSDELLADWVLTARADSLFGRAGLGPEFPLRPAGPDGFDANGTRITVTRGDGRVTGLLVNNRGLRDLVLTRVTTAQ